MKHIHYISWLLASTAEWLTIRDNSGVLAKIHWSKVTCTHTHTSRYIETPHTTYGASENGLTYLNGFYDFFRDIIKSVVSVNYLLQK